MKFIDIRTHTTALVFCFLVVQFASGQPRDSENIEYFVSQTGNDSNPGTNDAPFRLITRAQNEVRKRIASGLHSPVTVFISAGTYELKAPLVFDGQDSGTSDYAIRYVAKTGENVVISGGRSIKTWQVSSDGRWNAAMPEVKSGKRFFRQLVVNDQRAIRARWPNKDGEMHVTSVNSDVNGFRFDRPLAMETLSGQDTELVVYQNWSVTRARVKSSDAKVLTTETPMGWIGHGPATTASPGKTVFLEHAMRFLDQPGEWFLDRNAGMLHYLPSADSDPESTTIVAPVLKQLVEIAGTQESPVCNLHFERIRFEHADFLLPEFGYNEIQAAHFGTTLAAATFVPPVAIECVHAVNCSFQNCRFAHLNGSGIGLGVGCRWNVIDRCEVADVGGNGVMIGWRGKGNLKDGDEGRLDADWEDPQEAPRDNTISNCVISKCGADSFGGTGIWVAFSNNTRIVNNQVHNLPYTGISIGYRWNTTETSQSNCLVEANHIFDVMQKLADGGGIYTLGFQAGTVFRGNHIHDVHRSRFAHGGAPNNGFFIDEGSKGFKFENNVVHATSGDPVRFNNCRREWHTWIGNFFGDQAAKTNEARAIIKRAGVTQHRQSD